MFSLFFNIKNIISFSRIIFLFISFLHLEDNYSYFTIFLLLSKHIEYLNYVYFDLNIEKIDNILNDFVNLTTDIYLFSIFLIENENEIYKVIFFVCMLINIFSQNLRFLGARKNTTFDKKFKFINNKKKIYLIYFADYLNIIFFIFLIFFSKFGNLSETKRNLLILSCIGFITKNLINSKNLITGIISHTKEKK